MVGVLHRCLFHRQPGSIGPVLILAVLLLISPASVLRAAEADTPDLFIEVELDRRNPYVQAQVRYTARLYRRSALQQGYFMLPEVANVVIEPVGQDEPVDVIRHGRAYQMIAQRYLLFPQKSGRITLPGLVYSGREVYVRGMPLALEVRPRPAGNGDWLPARSLTIVASWHTPEPPWQAGDPLERTISIEAVGLTGAQLPRLTLPPVPGMAFQRLGTEVLNRIEDGQMHGRRIERLRLIPRQAGVFELPPLRVPWWDTGLEQQQEAMLPGRTLQVAPPPAAAPVTPEMQEPQVVRGEPMPGSSVFPLPLALGILGLFLALSWGLYQWFSLPQLLRWREQRRHLRSLRVACRRNDPKGAAAILLQWAHAHWGEEAPRTLGGIAVRLENDEAAGSLWSLDGRLYASESGVWDGGGFERQVLPLLRRGRVGRNGAGDEVLPPLNP